MNDRQARVAEIQARADAASPGPWHGCAHIEGTDADCPCGYAGDVWSADGEKVVVFLGRVGRRDPLTPPTLSDDDLEVGYANGRFIARAREDIPFLLEEIARLRRGLHDVLDVLGDIEFTANIFGLTCTKEEAMRIAKAVDDARDL